MFGSDSLMEAYHLRTSEPDPCPMMDELTEAMSPRYKNLRDENGFTHRVKVPPRLRPYKEICIVGGFENLILDAIYVPKRELIVGFIDWCDSGVFKGLIKPYHGSYYTRRAQSMIDGNRDGVQGEVVRKIFPQDSEIEKIAEQARLGEREVGLTQRFDNSTDMFVKILTGEMIRKMPWYQRVFA